MSDFVSDFWNLYVIVIVTGSILACAVLLIVQGKATFTPGKTMGHVWDETLEEYNNPMPKWWSWLFTITVIFAFVYLALYPGLGNFKGMLGWTSVGQHTTEVAKMDATVKPLFDKYLAMDVKAVASDKQANEMGKRLFLTYCMQCHGADARGAKGFPNLSDNDWLYGGEPEQIKETLNNGRMGVMPPHAQLGADTVKDLANFVRSLSGLPNDSVRAAKGKEAFTSAGCIGCHGPEGTGMHAVGAPNLTDKVWLYGSSEATITETINNGRQNKMPSWKEFLGEAKIHLLTAYVYSLSQGAK
ncbi:cytochrome-c oxidase, cbb3-type subunit III [Dechloromonas denitrificans]|uniref:cytochrome-c oxidase, cbb3-type subunit III n=1 Tax=Dechloromonas denitrificans TaxID=281362 RepID=UPI001CF8CC57|nr:cytochrome-c oxidase, cbb3-type subunit III [Dechloromonas denitrificans]UCV04509.1 cytochrome-c oxidase, cbb3-type subunit III [Dechloromonas denitrificans]UCV08839.1 cytochrome-c oxidase, cbb3-type subunit III [Dechloromonas denitrificans]